MPMFHITVTYFPSASIWSSASLREPNGGRIKNVRVPNTFWNIASLFDIWHCSSGGFIRAMRWC